MAQLQDIVNGDLDQLSDEQIADLLELVKTSVKRGKKEKGSGAKDLGLLIIRLAVGGFLSGHGSQKTLGWFEGYGLEATGQAFESGFGLKPGKFWAALNGGSELGGGTLTGLGLFHPLGPMMIIASMIMATAKVHRGKPIWVDKGGAETPLLYTSCALALIVAGPGKFSLDRIFGIRIPRWLVALVAASEIGMLIYGIQQKPATSPTEGQPETNATEGQKVRTS